MFKSTSGWIKSLIPSYKKEDIGWDKQNFLEWLFFLIIDHIFINVNKILKISPISYSRDQDSLLTRLVNTIIIFLFLFVISFIFLVFPLLTANNDPSTIKFIFQVVLIILFGSISWAGFVYLSWDFRDLVRSKIQPENLQYDPPLLEPFFLRQYFNGICIEWPSGKTIQFYLRDLASFVMVIFVLIYTMNQFLANSLNDIISHLGIFSFLQLLVILIPFLLVLFIVFVITSTIITVIIIFTFLLSAALMLSLDINPYLEMGGTQKYGDLIINTLYKIAFAIGILPLLAIFSEIDFNKILNLPQGFQGIQNQTMANLTVMTKEAINHSFDAVSIGTFSKYGVFLQLFFILALLAIITIVIIHFRINRRKKEELNRLEGMISYINFPEPENYVNQNRNQYLLSLYREVQNLREWPVKRIFVLELLISVLLLFISRIFS